MTKTRIVDLHAKASIVMIKERFDTLRTRYVEKAIKNENPMILQLVEEYKNFKGGRELEYKKLLCGVKTEFDSSDESSIYNSSDTESEN